MKQVVQPVAGGPVQVVDVPRPIIGPTEVLVQTMASVISSGTERAVTELARSTLVAKARARPDLLRQVARKARTEGVVPTVRAVRSRLGQEVPLGYSAAGVAVEVGEAVTAIAPGQLVATAGAGKANHAEFQAVPGLLCAPVPDGVPVHDAAFATLASVALHGLRLAEVGPGAKVVVIGAGLIGQLSIRLARASGCEVVAIDVADFPVTRAEQSGALALLESGESTTAAVLEWSRGRGADAVLLTAAASSSNAIRRAPALCRDRASVVVVGDVGLDLERTPFYEKELSLRFSRSYGPGRHERSYEDWAVDYPPGYVRWTEGRNLEAVLDLLASGRLQLADLVTHRFGIEEAAAAYALVESGNEPFLAVQLVYQDAPSAERPVRIRPRSSADGPGVGLVGAGAFASTVLVPALREAGFRRLVAVTSASGLSSRRLAERAGFEKAVSGAGAVIDDPEVDVVVVATTHDAHAHIAAKALRAGKHVFCEKPLALSDEELEVVEAAWRESGQVLFVDFNRRWSEPVRLVRRHFSSGSGPLVVTYRVNAGRLPEGHWYGDRRQGGRLIGEVSHFVDTCAALTGDKEVLGVHALGSPSGERLLAEDVVVALSYRDGDLATIAYATGGHERVEKERLEVHGRGRSAAVEDFVTVTLDGRRASLPKRDKGHVECLRAFRRALGDGTPAGDTALNSSRSTLLAARALLST